MKLLGYILFRYFVFLFRILPFKLIYSLSDLLSILLYRVIGYRKAIVLENLRNSFPDLSDEARKTIAKKSYRNLSDIMVEGIKGFSMTPTQIKNRYKFLNPELLDELFSKGQSVILVAGHYNNWEWAALSPPYYLQHKPVALYKGLHNPNINEYVKRSRSKTGVHLYELKDTARAFIGNVKDPSLFLLAADQSPSNVKEAFWVKFLNQDTACLHGPEKYALKYDLPLVFAYPKRVKRGYYEVTLEWLVKDVGQCKTGDITAAYMRRLEEVIKMDASGWLWSHKRWKHRR